LWTLSKSMNNDKHILLDSIQQVRDLFVLHQIKYFVGGSMMLYLRGVEVDVHDIDIFVDEMDYSRACHLLDHIAQPVEKEPNSLYQTTYFQMYQMGDISIDIMSEFKISIKDALFHYPSFMLVGEIMVHPRLGNIMLMFPEDWIVIYQLIHRPQKVRDICLYFETHLPNLERIMSICECIDNPLVSKATYQEVIQAINSLQS
jgi:hypothetical protein